MRIQRHSGFTLIELIVSIVLIGIIAAMLAPVIVTNIDAYVDTHERSVLQDKVRVALGRLGRELHLSTPQLTSASGSTLQFITTTAGGRYVSFNASRPRINNADCSKTRNQSPSQLERFLPGENIATLCVLSPTNLAGLPAQQRDALILGLDRVGISTITQQTSGVPDAYNGALWKITFDAEHSFSSASSNDSNVFSLADYRHRISLTGNSLVWQRTAASAAGFAGATSGILIDGVTAFSTSIDQHSGVVTVNLTVTQGSESISVTEDIYVRN